MKKQDLINKKGETFIFRYDPHSSFEGIMAEFWDAVDGKKQSMEPHIVRSNSIEALSTNMNKNRLRLFATLVEKKPKNLTELSYLLQKDYTLVRRDATILEGMGLIKLEKVNKEVRPIALYKRIVFDFPVFQEISAEKPATNHSAVQ